MSVRIASPRRSSPIDNIVNNLRIFVNLENTEGNRGLKGKWTARYHRQKPRPLKVKSSQVKASYERMINYFTSFFFFINPPRNTGVQHGRHWPEIERRFTRRTCPSVRHVRGGDRPGRCAPHISTIGIARSFPGDGIHGSGELFNSFGSIGSPFELCPILVAILEATFVSALCPLFPFFFCYSTDGEKKRERIGRLDRRNGIRVSVIYRETETRDSGVELSAAQVGNSKINS